MVAALLGLGASVAWGLADFIAGLKSRRVSVLVVLLASQATGLGLVALVVLARGEGPPDSATLTYAALASLAGTAGLAAFYRGLAVGAMAVVAPISATAAVIPVAVGVATGERPSALQGLGIAVALTGVALASRESGAAAGHRGRLAAGVGLALLAAVGIGTFLAVIDRASEGDVLWAIFASRVVGVGLVLAAMLMFRPSLAVERGDFPGLLAIGALDVTANTLFAVATTQGLVSVVAVLASLYPITTIVLARAVLHERVGRLQELGAAGAMAGVVLMTAGV